MENSDGRHRRAPPARRPRPRSGAAWSTTSSPTSGPGCAPASRSPSTSTPRSSRCPTTSPAHQLEGRLRTRLEDSLTAGLRPADPDRGHGQPAARRRRCAVDEVDPPGRHMAHEPPRTRRDKSTCRHVAFDGARAGQDAPSALETRLNPKYIFETFVIGSSNRFPHAAAVAVAEAPGKAYNPLLVYGDSGLGKTHLLHAIGHYVRSLYRGAKVRYVSSEEFTNEFINSIKDKRHRDLPAPLPRGRRAAHRRHPVPRGQDADAGGVLPHLQRAAQRQQADRADLRPGAQAARGSSRTGCAAGSSGA